MEISVLCGADLNDQGTSPEDCETINEVSVENASTGDDVNENIRRAFVNSNYITTSNLNANLESNNNNEFNFETCCCFCGEIAKFVDRKKDVDKLIISETFLLSVKNASEKRSSDDEWTQEVLGRMRTDLIGVNAVYHKNCRIGFRTNKPRPKNRSAPTAFNYKDGFLETVKLILAKNKLIYSINELIDEMNKLSDGNAYSFNQMKTNLIKYFGRDIVMSTYKNKQTMVILQANYDEILYEFHEFLKTETAIQRDIRKVSDVILQEIKNVTPNKFHYPSPSDINLNNGQIFLPKSLQLLLSHIITGHNSALKIVSIGQAIIQSNHRENVMSPLQLALAVQMHYFTGSKFVVNTLNAFGFCSTYGEVKKFELCASIALHEQEKNSNDSISVIKYVADNVDHNLRTLDGKNTFHGMGIISIHPPSTNQQFKIPRIKVTLQDIKEIGTVEIIPYFERMTTATSLFYRKLDKVAIQDSYSDLDFLWKVSWSKTDKIRPGWSGMMQLVQHGSHTGKATVNFLPIIDMNPTDYTCINSTLHFICNNAAKYNAMPTVTFDQPLYWKSRTIIENEPVSSPIKRVVVCLGAFHMKMSFLGTIGHIMSGTGLDVALAQVYGENSVIHMLSGKAYARAIRGLFMVDSALNSIIMDEIMNDQLSAKVDDLLKRTLDGRQNIDKLDEDETLQQIKLNFAKKKESYKNDSNSRLWLQFMDMIDILRSNIRAERTGNFKLNLETVQRMIAFFAASGHNSYTKSSYVFVQDMMDLQKTNPIVLNFFENGNFITRRTDRFWAGLPDDLIIEQMLMRSLKISGGLTRGRGMDDGKRSLWLYSLPARAEMNNAIQSVTNLKTETSDQHKECGESRFVRDNKDIDCIYNFFKERNPFTGTTSNDFRNIADGIISTSKANVDKAEEIGMTIVRLLEDKNVFEHSFERCKQVVRMSSKNELAIDGDLVTIDPDTLFQRLLLLILQSDRSDAEKKAAFCYELCHKAPSLFDETGLMREANPSTLLKSLTKRTGIVNIGFVEKLENAHYVIEGNWMINKVPWNNKDSFDIICDRYVTYVREKFGNATIVFDWSQSPSTNDESWLRGTKGALGMEMVFSLDTELKIKKDMFLRNKKNKQKFTELLTKKLEENGFTVHITFDNFTVMIAKVAVQITKHHNTIVVGNHPDIIMVLCYYAFSDSFSMLCIYEETAKKPFQIFNISELKGSLGEEKSKYLLFAHAMGGCTTTSQIHNISKATFFSKLENDQFANLAKIFCCPLSTQESVINAGNEVIVSVYNGKANESLNELRYRKFDEKVQRGGASKITSKLLPPTEAAAKFHYLRVFHQIQVWMELKLNPLNYGWIERNHLMRPVTTNIPAAPVDILSKIRCGCKGDCDSNRCSCYKVGFKCTTACGICAGNSCSNRSPIDDDSDSDEV